MNVWRFVGSQFRKRLNIGVFFFHGTQGRHFAVQLHNTILVQMAAPNGDSLLNFRKSFAKGVKRRTHMNSWSTRRLRTSVIFCRSWTAVFTTRINTISVLKKCYASTNRNTKLCTHSAYFSDSAVAGNRSAVGHVDLLQAQLIWYNHKEETTRYL